MAVLLVDIWLTVLDIYTVSKHICIEIYTFSFVCIYTYIIIIIIIKGHSLRRACLQPATNTQNSKPRPPTTNAYLPTYTYIPIIIIIKRRSGINPIPPTVIDRD